MATLLSLPLELLEQILRYDPRSVLQVARTCRELYALTSRLYLDFYGSRSMNYHEIQSYLKSYPQRLGYIYIDPDEITKSRYIIRFFARRPQNLFRRLFRRTVWYNRYFSMLYLWPRGKVTYEKLENVSDHQTIYFMLSLAMLMETDRELDLDLVSRWQILSRRTGCQRRFPDYARAKIWQIWRSYHEEYHHHPTIPGLVKLYYRLLLNAAVLGLNLDQASEWRTEYLHQNRISDLIGTPNQIPSFVYTESDDSEIISRIRDQIDFLTVTIPMALSKMMSS